LRLISIMKKTATTLWARRAHAELVERGVAVSDVQILGQNPQPVPDPLDNVGFIFFDDPDGNSWAVQQISARGRADE
jgi:hypothetical protein